MTTQTIHINIAIVYLGTNNAIYNSVMQKIFNHFDY